MTLPYELRNYTQYRREGAEAVEAGVIVEQGVSLTVNGEGWMTFMCTPTDLEALAVGFLFNEKVIETRDEVADVRVCDNQQNVDVWLHKSAVPPRIWKRTSGCTGGYTALEVEDTREIPPDRLKLEPASVLGLARQLFESQELYRLAGGVHSSALSDGKELLVRADDVGRHNTLDKIAGRMLLEDFGEGPWTLITTGRISSEMLQKAARMGAAVLISRTSPTSMSVELAQVKGITLIGYARGRRFNVYAHPERVFGEKTQRRKGMAALENSSGQVGKVG